MYEIVVLNKSTGEELDVSHCYNYHQALMSVYYRAKKNRLDLNSLEKKVGLNEECYENSSTKICLRY